jgi:hypothetical protein
MKMIIRQGARHFVAGFGLLALAAFAPPRTVAGGALGAEAVIRNWPVPSRVTAEAMIGKYGPPDQFDRHALAWFNNGNWKRTIVFRKSPPRSARLPGKYFLQQTIGYIVPNDKLAALKKFDRRLEVSQTAGELTFASNSEATNFIALNLADEIVVGKKNVAQAREAFAKTTRLAASGKSSPYQKGLQFDVDNTRYMTPTGADQ